MSVIPATGEPVFINTGLHYETYSDCLEAMKKVSVPYDVLTEKYKTQMGYKCIRNDVLD